MDKSKDHQRNNSKKKLKHHEKIELLLEEIATLSNEVKEQAPPTGKYSIAIENTSSSDNVEAWNKPIAKFKELPISQKTIKGLNESKFFKMTPIQRATLGHSFAGRDILGASKTGSGKTLCFLIPLLEILYRERWDPESGLAGLIIVPSRELAIQIFEVVNKIGRYHNFSVGMVIGGNNVEKEKNEIVNMNIVIGTPGRLLQHITETPMFNADNLQMLIIDEADRILDEGFEDDITEILSYLPKERQTMLFSATLTKDIKRLVKVNLKSPEYINISNTDLVIQANNEDNELSILRNKNAIREANNRIENSLLLPKNLNQFYTLAEAHEKVNILYSFLQTHKLSKCLVFVSSCKQVRYFSETFKHLKLGMTILDLHGRQKQKKRSNTFYTFSQKRNSVVLFATDVASRGVDFPAIDWVIQLDAPEDLATYIHRVGRTARYKSQGNAVLLVSPKEEYFVSRMKEKGIEITKMKIPPNKIVNMQSVLRSILSEHQDMISMAERAINSYIKSVNLFSNKKVFDISTIDLNKLALSYGLVSSPQMIKIKVNQKEEEEEEDKGADNDDGDLQQEEGTKINNAKLTAKKGKLHKLKEKIKEKKIQQEKITNANISSQSLEEKEEEEEFLTEKVPEKDQDLLQKKTKRESKRIEEKPIKKAKKDIDADNEMDINKEEEEEEYYSKVKSKLSQNKENDKVKEKVRIFEKHKQDRMKKKQKDYEKHRIANEDDEYEEEEESVHEGDINENEETKYNNKAKHTIKVDISSQEKQIKINVHHSSIKEKEEVVLALLQKKNKLLNNKI